MRVFLFWGRQTEVSSEKSRRFIFLSSNSKMTENLKKRRSFTLPVKLEAVKYAEEHSGEAASRKYNVDPKTIRDWRKLKQSYRKPKLL